MGIHFYDSVAVFERGAYTKKVDPEMGGAVNKLVWSIRQKLGFGFPPP
jgi:hypothetical protein